MKSLNTAKAPFIPHDSPEVKDVVGFADRFWYVLEQDKKSLGQLCTSQIIITMLI
jgi:hypothetical protein